MAGQSYIPTANSVMDHSIHPQESAKPGWKTYLIHDALFEVPERYDLINCVGRGAFGIVCAAKTGDDGDTRVAIKKVQIREDNILEVKRLVRELYLLHHFDHEHVIGLLDIVEPSTEESFHEIYVVSQLMDTDLHHVIRSHQDLSEGHMQFFLYQLLRGLKAIHSAKVLHRDLKPSNIIVNSNCDLRICDFGLAREQDLSNDMTDYVATRWYRAPELLMQTRGYGGSVDMWSVGCIFAELIRRKPLLPGKNYLDQLHLILDLIGSPSDQDIASIGSEKARNYVRQLRPKKQRRDFRQLFPSVSDEAIDLLQRMLVFNPNNRITAEDTLRHNYFKDMYEPDDVPDAPVFEFDFDMNDPTLTVFDLKEMLWKVLTAFHPDFEAWKWFSDEEKADAARQKEEKVKKKADKDRAAAAAASS